MSPCSRDQKLIYFGIQLRARPAAANAGCQIGILHFTQPPDNSILIMKRPISLGSVSGSKLITSGMDLTLGEGTEMPEVCSFEHGNLVDGVREYRASNSAGARTHDWGAKCECSFKMHILRKYAYS